jgi:hypothetical protein
MRESARKAFHEADNKAALRRAALRRERPSRGFYNPGEWIMYWRSGEAPRAGMVLPRSFSRMVGHQCFAYTEAH